jgi:MoxR-like ATPase
MSQVQRTTSQTFERAVDVLGRVQANAETVVLGKGEQIRLVLAALVCNGHVLFEDVPGTAKTMLARSIAGSIEGTAASRIQCTPDLQPTDITGLSVWDPEQRRFEFQPGPIFANVVVVDEINRALPKAQSALLEGMAERQVTVDGVTRPLPAPFLIIATENSIEQEGTFPLPEAQLDRFLIRTSLGYPSLEEELQIVEAQLRGHPLDQLRPVVTTDEFSSVFSAIEDVYVDPLLKRWTIELVRATRELDLVEVGASVRGSLALERVSRAWALAHGRDFVTPEDVEQLFLPVIAHRIVLAPEVVMDEGISGEAAVRRVWEACLARAPRPEPEWDAGGRAVTS